MSGHPGLITNSRLKVFRACPRAHELRYNQCVAPLEDAEALTFGTAMHAGLEAWWKTYQADRFGAGALDCAQAAIASRGLDDVQTARASVLMAGYHARWHEAMLDFDVLAVEAQFIAPLRTPSGKAQRVFRLAGKIDAVVRRVSTGEVWGVEHKTSGADLSPGSTYWTRLRMDSQVSLYFDGGKALGFDFAGMIYDVLAKPEQKPYKATPIDSRKYTKEGKLYANQREADETIDEYKARLIEVVSGAPESFFQRSEVVRLDSELEAARLDVFQSATLIRQLQRTGMAPRNPDACHAYGRPCAYLSVCEGRGDVDDPMQFKRLVSPHPELTT